VSDSSGLVTLLKLICLLIGGVGLLIGWILSRADK
jgi:hypothetical protein